MKILGLIAVFAISYFSIYGIARICAIITVFFHIAWAVTIGGCIAIVLFLGGISLMNYLVVGLTIYLLIPLIRTQFRISIQKISKKIDVSAEYRQALGRTYACIYSFLVFSLLYTNFYYILSVPTKLLSFEEYKESSLYMGFVLSGSGVQAVKWFILALAAVAFFQVPEKTQSLDVNYTSKLKQKMANTSPKKEIGVKDSIKSDKLVSPIEKTADTNQLK